MVVPRKINTTKCCRLLSRPAPRAGLVALRQSFVRRCHGRRGSRGFPRSASQNVAEGQSAFEAVTFYGRQKQLRRPLPLVGPPVHWQIDFLSALPPCRTCCFAP